MWSGLLLGEHVTAATPVTAALVLAAMTLCVNSRERT
jgi:hypothetical protein